MSVNSAYLSHMKLSLGLLFQTFYNCKIAFHVSLCPGQWLKNQRHGQGRMQYSNGDAYEGLWVKDHRHGIAKYFYANGDIFVGRFQHNRREGLGTIYMASVIAASFGKA